MVRHVVEVVGLEDAFLIAGAIMTSVGAGLELGAPVGLIVAGVLCLFYGVWIARGSTPDKTEGGGE